MGLHRTPTVLHQVHTTLLWRRDQPPTATLLLEAECLAREEEEGSDLEEEGVEELLEVVM